MWFCVAMYFKIKPAPLTLFWLARMRAGCCTYCEVFQMGVIFNQLLLFFLNKVNLKSCVERK